MGVPVAFETSSDGNHSMKTRIQGCGPGLLSDDEFNFIRGKAMEVNPMCSHGLRLLEVQANGVSGLAVFYFQPFSTLVFFPYFGVCS